MGIKSIEEFKKDCNNKRCNRGTFYNEKTCITEYKQNSCYTKYLNKLEKDKEKRALQIVKNKEKQISKPKKPIHNVLKIDERDIELKKIVWLRDSGMSYNGNSKRRNWQDYCVFWNFIFTREEKLLIVKTSFNDLWLNQSLDLIHIEARSNRPDLIYDSDNIILGGRLWHSRLDQYRNILTGKMENKNYRDKWIERIKKYIENIKG